MKITILVPRFTPRWLAGTEIATYHIAKYLARLGHEIHIVTSRDSGLPKESKDQGFHVHRVRALFLPNLFTLSFLIPTALIIKRLNPDVIHAQSIPVGLISVVVKKLLRKPYIVWGQGSDVYLPWLFKETIVKLVLVNANAVIALTDDMKRSISKLYAGYVDVIHNGIELDDFTNVSREESCKKLNMREDEKRILFLGRFRPEKNLACLVEAAKIIAEQNPKTKLWLAGEGPEEAKLTALTEKLNLEQHVAFLGQIAHEKVPEYMAAADVFVLPSLSEGFPVVLPEAMACGLPIVATRVGGIPEIITDGENGLLVEPGNPEQLAEAVLKILADDGIAERMSANNKVKVRQYSWQITAERLVEVYRKIVPAN